MGWDEWRKISGEGMKRKEKGENGEKSTRRGRGERWRKEIWDER